MARKPPVKVSDVEITNAISDNHGNLRVAAGKLKIAYGTIVARMKHCPEAKQAKVDAIADMIEIAEDVVYNELLSGNFSAAKFTLERLSRDKWGNKPQITNDTDEYPEPIMD